MLNHTEGRKKFEFLARRCSFDPKEAFQRRILKGADFQIRQMIIGSFSHAKD
jgi:hypothetical protein